MISKQAESEFNQAVTNRLKLLIGHYGIEEFSKEQLKRKKQNSRAFEEEFESDFPMIGVRKHKKKKLVIVFDPKGEGPWKCWNSIICEKDQVNLVKVFLIEMHFKNTNE